MERFQDWRSRLNTEIVKRRDMEFRYGIHDCCYSSAACVRAMTGVDVQKSLVKHHYRGEKQAKMVLQKVRGVKGILNSFVRKYKLEEVSTTRAQAGDVVLYIGDEGATIGIVALSAREFLVPSRESGWTTLKIAEALKVWRV